MPTLIKKINLIGIEIIDASEVIGGKIEFKLLEISQMIPVKS
jgi:hypothetical protein